VGKVEESLKEGKSFGLLYVSTAVYIYSDNRFYRLNDLVLIKPIS
jgi:hypothetical protein